jgi:hypothetical protein
MKTIPAALARRLTTPVAAILAAFLVMGGTAVAAKMITGAQIKNNSITGVDVKNRSLTSADFAGSVSGGQGGSGAQGARGPTGAGGPAGATGATGVTGPPGSPGAPGITATYPFSSSSAGTVPGSTPRIFVGSPTTAVVGAGQTLTISGTVVLGLSTGTLSSTGFYVQPCYRLVGSGTTPTGIGYGASPELTTTRAAISLAYTSSPAAGTYNVGMCVTNSSGTAIDDTESVTGIAQVSG